MSRFACQNEWNDTQLGELRSLWMTELSTAAIAKELRMTKDAVIGKAHRIGLPGRPSPIKRSDAPRQDLEKRERNRAEVRGRRTTLAPIASAEEMKSAIAEPVTIARVRTSEPCCWPIGTPGKPSFRYCDLPSLPGRPYCQEHAAIAYVNKRDQGEAA